MQHRIAGTIVIVGALYFLWIGLRAVFDAQEITNMFAEFGPVFDRPIDRTTLLLHWRVSYTLFALASFLALVAGVAMVLLKRWSWLLLTATFTAALVISVLGRLTGYIHYGFEGGSPKELSVLALIAIATYVAYRKWPKRPAK